MTTVRNTNADPLGIDDNQISTQTTWSSVMINSEIIDAGGGNVSTADNFTATHHLTRTDTANGVTNISQSVLVVDNGGDLGVNSVYSLGGSSTTVLNINGLNVLGDDGSDEAEVTPTYVDNLLIHATDGVDLTCDASGVSISVINGYVAPVVIGATGTYVLPTNGGSMGEVLGTDGSGNLLWVDPGVGVGNVDTVAGFTLQSSIVVADPNTSANNVMASTATVDGSGNIAATSVVSLGGLTTAMTFNGLRVIGDDAGGVDVSPESDNYLTIHAANDLAIANTTSMVAIQIPTASAAPVIVGSVGPYVLPAGDGTAGQVCTTDGAGNLSFQSVEGVPSYVPSLVYFTQLFGDDDAGDGSYGNPVASLTQAIILSNILAGEPATTYTFICLDGATYDEEIDLSGTDNYVIDMYTTIATLASSTGDSLTITGAGANVRVGYLSSTGGNALTATGYPVVHVSSDFNSIYSFSSCQAVLLFDFCSGTQINIADDGSFVTLDIAASESTPTITGNYVPTWSIANALMEIAPTPTFLLGGGGVLNYAANAGTGSYLCVTDAPNPQAPTGVSENVVAFYADSTVVNKTCTFNVGMISNVPTISSGTTMTVGLAYLTGDTVTGAINYTLTPVTASNLTFVYSDLSGATTGVNYEVSFTFPSTQGIYGIYTLLGGDQLWAFGGSIAMSTQLYLN